jgi:hypothetical protein
MSSRPKALIALFLIFSIFGLLFGRIIIAGDGISYYALTVSLLRDHDFDLKNQKRQIKSVKAPINPITAKPASLYSCGFALIYAPFVYAAEQSSSWSPSAYPQNNEIPFQHALGVFIGSFILALLAAILAFLFLKNSGASVWISLLIIILIFAGTPLMFFTFVMPCYSHAADTFLTTAIFFLVFSKINFHIRNALLGIALALSILLRNNNIVLLVPALGGLLFLQRKEGWKIAFATLIEIFVGAVPFLIVHIRFNLSQYGKILATGYRIQTEYGFLAEMLFHPWAGLFVWTPITALALIGLVIGSLARKPLSVISLIAVLSVLFTVQFQPNWWGGYSFGLRFVTHLYFFWIVGLFELHLKLKRFSFIPAIACTLWTFVLFNAFFINTAYPEGRAMLQYDKSRHTPIELLQSTRQQYINYGKDSNPLKFWFDSLSTGPTIQTILRKQSASSQNKQR